MWTPACSVRGVEAETRQIHTDYLWRKRDCTATLSRGERPDPCLDRLLLLFWAHYIEELGPHQAERSPISEDERGGTGGQPRACRPLAGFGKGT